MRSDVVRAFVEQSNAPTCRVHPSWAPSYILPSLRQVFLRYRSRTSHAETPSRSAWFAIVRAQRSFLTLSDTSHSHQLPRRDHLWSCDHVLGVRMCALKIHDLLSTERRKPRRRFGISFSRSEGETLHFDMGRSPSSSEKKPQTEKNELSISQLVVSQRYLYFSPITTLSLVPNS